MKILLTNRYYDQYKQIIGIRRKLYLRIKYYIMKYLITPFNI